MPLPRAGDVETVEITTPKDVKIKPLRNVEKNAETRADGGLQRVAPLYFTAPRPSVERAAASISKTYSPRLLLL